MPRAAPHRRRTIVLPLLFLAAAGPFQATPALSQEQRPTHPAIERTFGLVRDAFSGTRALETTAFVAQFWRLPGNRGYDASIDRVRQVLESAGYVSQDTASPDDRLTYRIEQRSMNHPAWEPVDARVTIVGQDEPLLRFQSNRNMIAINSHATEGVVEAEVVDVGAGRRSDFEGLDVKGKIVLGDAGAWRLYRQAVGQRGALGVLAYSIPDYNRPKEHPDSIAFSRIPLDRERSGWALLLSTRARDQLRQAMAAGPVRVRVAIDTQLFDSVERTLIADVRGSRAPEERFVFSAHVQEPGANDNASGVGGMAEMARVLGQLVGADMLDPARTITFIWGDEISAPARYLRDDPERLEGVRWGLSLDMIGEDTSKTGGTFLIEKMPDPSAIWTRGDDRHTEWGGRPLRRRDLAGHYFNDFILNRCLEQAAGRGWVVRTNPFEGGSDHVPFLTMNKPGVLLWHFTDVYYHTDGDRIEMVSAETLEHVGVSALVVAVTLCTADASVARFIVQETAAAGRARMEAEAALSRSAIESGQDRAQEMQILQAWIDWYGQAIRSTIDVEVGGASTETADAVEHAAGEFQEFADGHMSRVLAPANQPD